ncbi:class I SAM-dependent methyltransferase [Arthrobacter woluwensis]|uniref:class I SAM-dependent methyltransferase n=1 Tax=Arthrobacter woluwensis TaxID=156980 RepID=UPI0020D072E3|nr:class I SAM-dependent methyltransferase [Arthrobacter woluwensis]
MNPEPLHRLLSRWPDVDAENLQAFDAADRLLLEHAASELDRLWAEGVDDPRLVVIGDRYGAIALPLLAESPEGGQSAVAGLRVWQDLATGEAALEANAGRLGITGFTRIRDDESSSALYGPELLGGARLVLLRLPKNLAELAELSEAIAEHAHPGVVVLAAGMVKHMTLSMNEVLGAEFGTVTASLAKGKARVLRAVGPGPNAEPDTAPDGALDRATAADRDAAAEVPRRTAGEPDATRDPGQKQDPGRGSSSFPAREFHEGLGRDGDLSLEVHAHGAVFAGARVDIGTRFLLEFLPRMPRVSTAVDLGCGSGVLATLLAASQPEVRVVACDVSAAAVRSARLTAGAHGVGDRVLAVHTDALEGFPPASAELILLNPPFHLGHSVHAGAALKLFRAAADVLTPGGELWTVWNSHLGYVPALEKHVGPTAIMGRNKKFTVTRTRRPVADPA